MRPAKASASKPMEGIKTEINPLDDDWFDDDVPGGDEEREQAIERFVSYTFCFHVNIVTY